MAQRAMRFLSGVISCLFVLFTNPLVVDAQQNPDGRFNVVSMSEPFLFLVRDPYVHRELQLKPSQLVALQSLNDKGDMKIWPTRNLPAEKAQEMITMVRRVTREQVAKILTGEQRERLQQIELWVQGIRSLARPDVVRQLELTGTQQQAIADMFEQFDATRSTLIERQQQGESLDELNRELREHQLQLQRKVASILSAQQQQLWIALLGKRIDVSQLGKVKFKAPDIQAPADSWIHSDPLTLEQLKGKVVALHFFAFA